MSRERSRYVIETSGTRFIDRDRNPADSGDPRIYFFGDDLEGVALEVVAAEISDDEFLVIHAMELRDRYRELYKKAKGWRK